MFMSRNNSNSSNRTEEREKERKEKFEKDEKKKEKERETKARDLSTRPTIITRIFDKTILNHATITTEMRLDD